MISFHPDLKIVCYGRCSFEFDDVAIEYGEFPIPYLSLLEGVGLLAFLGLLITQRQVVVIFVSSKKRGFVEKSHSCPYVSPPYVHSIPLKITYDKTQTRPRLLVECE